MADRPYDWAGAGLPEDMTGGSDALAWLEAGKAWLLANTAYVFPEEGPLPPALGLFLRRYRETVERAGVRDEAIGGLRQSFFEAAGAGAALRELAAALLPEHCPAARFVAAARRWNG